MRPLNLASQPFRNETLPAVLFGLASVLLLALTVQHAFVVRGLLPARTSKLHTEVAALEAEAERLRTEGRTLKAPAPEARVVAEWSVLKDLVDRRTFSWTGLFARLEQVLPREVRLVEIVPDVDKGHVSLSISAVARPAQAGLGLVGLLEAREEFEDVYPESVSERDGGAAEFHYTMRYLPGEGADLAAAPAALDAEQPAAGPPPPSPSDSAAPGPAPVTSPAGPGAMPAAPATAPGPGQPSPSPGPPATKRGDRPEPSKQSRESSH
jgi:hypothetical protein